MIKWIVNKALDSKFYAWFIKDIFPHIRFTTALTRSTGLQYHRGYRLLYPGCFILTVDYKKASTLVPGLFSHAAFCVAKGGDCEYEIAEMTSKNYTKSFYCDVWKESDRQVIAICKDWNHSHIEKMIDICIKKFSAAKYDIKFSLDVNSLYCSELIFQLDRYALRTPAELVYSSSKGILKADLSDLAGIGKPYISPDGLLFAKNTVVIYDSKGEFTGMSGIQIERYCRQRGYIS